MAESASTGNSGTGSTGTGATGNSGSTGNGGSGNGSTGTTSTSNSGPAAPGSQTSSNGSFSTGSGNGNGNNGKGKGPIGNLGVKGTGPNGEKGTWAHTVSPDSNGNLTVTPGPDGKHTVHATFFADPPSSSGSKPEPVKPEPVMTVDEVYGKNNQSIVENQGDYEASSNEKSNVETSTFGKQDEISVTPVSVTKDEGLVNNEAIQAVEGLNFQQKDKANQEVTEAKKSRDEAEAEDNADGMRDQLKSVAEKDAEEDDSAFQVGDRDEDVAAAKAEVDRLANEKVELEQEQKENAENLKSLQEEVSEKEQAISREESDYQAKEANMEQLDDIGRNMQYFSDKYQELANKEPTVFARLDIQQGLKTLEAGLKAFCEQVGIVPPNVRYNAYQAKDALESFQGWKETVMQERFNGLKDFSQDSIDTYKSEVAEGHFLNLQQLKTELAELEGKTEIAEGRQNELQGLIADNNEKSAAAKEAYDNLVSETFVGEEAPAAEAEAEEAPTTEAPSYKGIIKGIKDEINNSKELTDEQKAEADTVLGNVEAATDEMNKAANELAANPNDVDAVKTYIEVTAKYNKALKDAKGDKTLKNTDFNETFTKAVAAANDFMVGEQSYAEFAAKMAVKSPELAKGLYEAKAENYETNGHKVLAAIETAKSKMVMTWLGSKFTFADNQVRSQFNQMAKTDMRATYATYNNVLNDPNATPEQKAEAFKAINQANSLMTASAALQASTGFFSGIGDGTSDGVYGTTGKLNGYQEALNVAGNFAKIVLGLGVTPGANEAYQNMYYMAGAKVNESGLFSKDFDGDGFALCQEYGNNAAVGMIAGAGELAAGVALMFNPATSQLGINLAIDSVQTFFDGLYGVQKEVNESIKYSSEVLSYLNEAKSIVAETGNKEAIGTMDNAIKQVEDFQLKSDEVDNLDNWLEGSGSNTADNGKFNQALSYDEWLKLIEADPVMQEYAKSLNR